MEVTYLTNGQVTELLGKYQPALTKGWVDLDPNGKSVVEAVGGFRDKTKESLKAEVFRILVERNRENGVDMKLKISGLKNPGDRLEGLCGVDLGRYNAPVVKNFELVVMSNGTLQYNDPEMPDIAGGTAWVIYNPDTMVFFEQSFLDKLVKLFKSEIEEFFCHLENMAIVVVLKLPRK